MLLISSGLACSSRNECTVSVALTDFAADSRRQAHYKDTQRELSTTVMPLFNFVAFLLYCMHGERKLSKNAVEG